jgi:hypothetical protein
MLNSMNVTYEAYPVIMLAIMESPAIMIGLVLAGYSRKIMGGAQKGEKGMFGHLAKEAFTNGSILLLFLSMGIGYVVSEPSYKKIEPFFEGIFMGALCIFLCDMGMEAGKRISEFKTVGIFLVAFGIVMPIIGATFGMLVGHYYLQYSVGGVTLVTVLAASCSYIAVPPAMRLAIPEANPSFYLTLSLGVTFALNIVIGFPTYYAIAQHLAGQC